MADPSTIRNKLLVGYQGSFACDGDGTPGEENCIWYNWLSASDRDGLRPLMDILPDVSKYQNCKRYEVPGFGNLVFSSRDQATVKSHFKLMADHSIDGAFLQVKGKPECEITIKLRKDVGLCVKAAAKSTGRVWAIVYDLSGFDLVNFGMIKHDWKGLMEDWNDNASSVFQHPNYLKENRKPVVAMSGFRDDRIVRSAISHIKTLVGVDGVYLVARVPADWKDQAYANACLECFDAISPWTVGSYRNIEEANKFAEDTIASDIKWIEEYNQTNGKEVTYIPVVFPGRSAHNLSNGELDFNDIPREGGEFLWRQIDNAMKHGASTICGANWDSYNDGTALMPFITRGAQPPFITPEGRPPLPIILIPQERPPPFDFESQPPPEFIAPGKQDSLPSDWYMRICGLAVEWLRRVTEPPENFPCESLEKYWSNRSEYVFDAEDRDPPPYQLISDRVGVSVYNVYSDWVQESREDVNEPYHTSHIAFPSPAEGFHLPSIGPVDESLSPVLSIDGQVPLLVPSQSTKPGDQGNVFTDIFRRTSKSIKRVKNNLLNPPQNPRIDLSEDLIEALE